jgi:hypothetical protein
MLLVQPSPPPLLFRPPAVPTDLFLPPSMFRKVWFSIFVCRRLCASEEGDRTLYTYYIHMYMYVCMDVSYIAYKRSFGWDLAAELALTLLLLRLLINPSKRLSLQDW